MAASDTTYSGGTLKQVNITATRTSSAASTVGNLSLIIFHLLALENNFIKVFGMGIGKKQL
jgi:hypothetical protein